MDEKKDAFPIYPCWNSSGPHPAGFPESPSHSSWWCPAEPKVMDYKHTQTAVCVSQSDLQCDWILINILSEQHQCAALTPELCSCFPGGVGEHGLGEDRISFTPPAPSSSSEGDREQAGSKSRNPFLPATANSSRLCAGRAHPSLQRMPLLVKLGLSPPLPPFCL